MTFLSWFGKCSLDEGPGSTEGDRRGGCKVVLSTSPVYRLDIVSDSRFYSVSGEGPA